MDSGVGSPIRSGYGTEGDVKRMSEKDRITLRDMPSGTWSERIVFIRMWMRNEQRRLGGRPYVVKPNERDMERAAEMIRKIEGNNETVNEE